MRFRGKRKNTTFGKREEGPCEGRAHSRLYELSHAHLYGQE